MMKPKKDNKFPLEGNLEKRWSGRIYADKPVEKDDLLSLFEAARWSASCFNEQPWRFLVGVKGEETYDKIFDMLVEFNQDWAKTAPVLVLAYAKKTFTKNGKPNMHYWYDTGQAMASLTVQATHLDLNVHQMGGYDRDRAQKELIQDDDFESICVAAIGYRAEPSDVPENLKEREFAPQTRLALKEVIKGI
ncbi:nitroreductase family protein [Fulvivirga sp.]|uniref:nitroreductase family protein n=1 Tax=Fulvivirga sp. TaxID=1931237 RepID=UPI0032EFA5FE